MEEVTNENKKEQPIYSDEELRIIIDNEAPEILGKLKNAKMRLWFPGMKNKYISRWKELNRLFIEYYPGEIQNTIPSLKSHYATKNLRIKLTELAQSLQSSAGCDTERLEQFKEQRKEIIEIEKSSPYGYIEFLNDVELISSTMDHLIIDNPDFFAKFPIGYFTDDYLLCERQLSLLQFAFKLKEYLDPISKRQKNLFSSNINDSKSFLKLKIGDEMLSIEKFWAPQIINSILEDIDVFFKEQSNYYGFEIDIWSQSEGEIRKKIKYHMSNNLKVKGENSTAYIVGNLIEILKWPGARQGQVTTDSSEFIFRFLKIFNLDENKIEGINKSFEEEKKDDHGRPIKGSSYHRQRNEVFQRCRVIKNSYEKLID